MGVTIDFSTCKSRFINELFPTFGIPTIANVNVIYAKARSKAALEKYPEALELLKQAISRNPKIIRKWAKEESIFTVLHNNDKFRALVKL